MVNFQISSNVKALPYTKLLNMNTYCINYPNQWYECHYMATMNECYKWAYRNMNGLHGHQRHGPLGLANT